MAAQHWHWFAGASALFLMIFSGVAEKRRHNRRTLDDIGWVPWRGIQVAAVFAFLLVVILVLKNR